MVHGHQQGDSDDRRCGGDVGAGWPLPVRAHLRSPARRHCRGRRRHPVHCALWCATPSRPHESVLAHARAEVIVESFTSICSWLQSAQQPGLWLTGLPASCEWSCTYLAGHRSMCAPRNCCWLACRRQSDELLPGAECKGPDRGGACAHPGGRAFWLPRTILQPRRHVHHRDVTRAIALAKDESAASGSAAVAMRARVPHQAHCFVRM